jgi:SAM-dependent methyltransferase
MRATDLIDAVRDAYSAIAGDPRAEHPIPVGRALAEGVGYPAAWLDSVPTSAVDAFAGVSCLPCFTEVPPRATVLDLGCGAGLDTLLLARRAETVIGVDFSEAMLARARAAAEQMGAVNVVLRRGDARALPVEPASIDVALVNGLFNLNPDRDRIFKELARVVRPGGAVYAAELVLNGPLPPEEAGHGTSWFA